MDLRDVAIACARIADEKKAQDIIILDISKLTFITQYFVICTGTNERQLHTISDEIEKHLKKSPIEKHGIEGYQDPKWILMDYGDIIVHIFGKETRNHYDLELLWGDAPRIEW